MKDERNESGFGLYQPLSLIVRPSPLILHLS